MRARTASTALALTAVALVTSCGAAVTAAAPGCAATERVAVVAQSVSSASYVPCLAELPPGWRATGFTVGSSGTRIELSSDRSDGPPVLVELADSCSTTGATATAPSAPGVRSSVLVDSISPRYAGTSFDVFPGGCVRTAFDVPRGAHIPLLEQLDDAVQLVPRREVRVAVRRELGVELDP